MSGTTDHGENIANQIQCEDAYGEMNDLTLADVWNIVDNLQSHFIDTSGGQISAVLGKWMDTLEKMDEDLPL